jgi:hypothetical protein
MDALILIFVRLLEVMFATGIVFSAFAVVAGAIDFARTFAEGDRFQ